jgi:hypothetical protein
MIDFSEKFSTLSGKDFIDLLAARGNLRFLVVGSNFRCGYQHATDAALIKKMNLDNGIPTEVAAPVSLGGARISSSRIRAAIASGSLVEASELLGRRVEIDFAGLSAVSGAGGVYFNLAGEKRVLPPPGRYPALLFGNSPWGTDVEIVVGGEGVFIPLDDPEGRTVRRVEFLSGSR